MQTEKSHPSGQRIMPATQCMGTPLCVSTNSAMGNIYCDLMFTSLEGKALPKWCLLLKERICSHGSVPRHLKKFSAYCGSFTVYNLPHGIIFCISRVKRQGSEPQAAHKVLAFSTHPWSRPGSGSGASFCKIQELSGEKGVCLKAA